MNFVSLPTQVNLAHLVFGLRVICFIWFPVVVDLFRIQISYLLLRNTCLIVLYSFSVFMIFKLCFPFLVTNLIVVSLCSWG